MDPRPEDIDIVDIAHALSLLCRYNGHCGQFYSVAEHSLRMSDAKELPGDSRWRLMHDAAEAYLGDIPSPIKAMLPKFTTMENVILEAIGERFGLGRMNQTYIHAADRVMLATEKRDIIIKNIEWPIYLPEPLKNKIIPMSSVYVEQFFLQKAKELGI